MECYAGRSIAAVEKRLSAMEAGDVLGAARGYCDGSRFLEAVLDREETVVPISSMDA